MTQKEKAAIATYKTRLKEIEAQWASEEGAHFPIITAFFEVSAELGIELVGSKKTIAALNVLIDKIRNQQIVIHGGA